MNGHSAGWKNGFGLRKRNGERSRIQYDDTETMAGCPFPLYNGRVVHNAILLDKVLAYRIKSRF